MELYRDDMVFKPYGPDVEKDGWQCIMRLRTGKMSVRFGCTRLVTSETAPYEVQYPNGRVVGYKTADNIWDFIKQQANG